MSGRNKCLQYNTTQNDRGTLYLLFIYKSKKNHTIMLFNIYTELQYGIIQYNVLQTCQGIIKNKIILLNLI